VLSRHDSRAAPQTVQTASPVCGTKNFSSVRLYSAPQLHCTIVAIPGICASDRRFSSPELCHNRTDPLPTRQRFQTKNHLRKLVPRELSLSKSSGLPLKADVALCRRHVSKVPISEVPDATLRRRQKQRNYSRVQSDRRGTRRVDASAMGCEAKALQRSLPDEATGAMPPMT
jgi:hypothetical protein